MESSKEIPILVTGGAGYIGSHICKYLKRAGYLPIAFDNLSQGHESSVKWGPLIKGDLLDKEALNHAFLQYKPKGIMHFAASALVVESIENPSKYYWNNLVGTLNLLDCAIENNIKHIIFSSTCATYGLPETIPIKEDHFQKPLSPYGKSKLMIEKLLKDYEVAYGLRFISLRYFNAAGADIEGEIGEDHNPETHLIPIIIEVALRKREYFTIFGNTFNTKDGYAIRDYIHINDLTEAHIKALNWLLENNTSMTFNLGTGTGYSVLEVLKAAESTLKISIPQKLEKKRAGEPPILIANKDYAEKILDWKLQYSDLSTIIKTAYKWHKNALLSAQPL